MSTETLIVSSFDHISEDKSVLNVVEICVIFFFLVNILVSVLVAVLLEGEGRVLLITHNSKFFKTK